MSDPELTQVRAPEVVTVTVFRARDLVSANVYLEKI